MWREVDNWSNNVSFLLFIYILFIFFSICRSNGQHNKVLWQQTSIYNCLSKFCKALRMSQVGLLRKIICLQMWHTGLWSEQWAWTNSSSLSQSVCYYCKVCFSVNWCIKCQEIKCLLGFIRIDFYPFCRAFCTNIL